jgi:hypothetical protein
MAANAQQEKQRTRWGLTGKADDRNFVKLGAAVARTSGGMACVHFTEGLGFLKDAREVGQQLRDNFADTLGFDAARYEVFTINQLDVSN